MLLEETDRRFSVSIDSSSNRRFLVIHSASSETAESYLLDLQTEHAALLSVCRRVFGIQYEVDHCHGHLAQACASHFWRLSEASGLKSGGFNRGSSRGAVCLGFLYILTDKDGVKMLGIGLFESRARNSKLCRTPLSSIPSQSEHWEDLWLPEEQARLLRPPS